MAATILAACGAMALIRTGGFTASFRNDLHWRWTQTPEERLVAQSGNLPPAPPPVRPVAETPAPEKPVIVQSGAKFGKKPATLPLTPAGGAPDRAEAGALWPGFRGPHRDGIVSGVRIKTDWTTSPPVAMWRRPIGPGWSSFAVRGDLIYTQEQRGPDEVVACYKLTTGEPVWAHRDTARFWESNGGPGPRGTPTLSTGRVYTFGATGIVNALDAGNGAVVWSRNAASEAAMKTPTWGFASSPLVVGDLVIVGVSGRLVAYDRVTGAPRWMGPSRGASYSSPRLLTIDGVAQVLLLSAAGATSVRLADGALLWEHPWKGYPIVQPNLTAEGDVLISVSDSSGIRRLALAHTPGDGPVGWNVAERWTSNGLKPYFNDFVVHNGHAYGFDGSILSCIDVKDGMRKWKGGRYGNGQLILLADQDLLLALSEEGELALVRATPDQFIELARFPAIEGKTWNHPALAGDVLLVRNGEEMAAFRLSLADR
jgi:outer membrane protein assembly factor BamB